MGYNIDSCRIAHTDFSTADIQNIVYLLLQNS